MKRPTRPAERHTFTRTYDGVTYEASYHVHDGDVIVSWNGKTEKARLSQTPRGYEPAESLAGLLLSELVSKWLKSPW